MDELKKKTPTYSSISSIFFFGRQPKRRIHEPQISKLLMKSPARKSSIVDDSQKLTPKKADISEEETRECAI